MAQLRIHNSQEELVSERLKHNLSLSPMERMKLAFNLMALSARFKEGPLKEPAGKGLILRK